MLIKFIFAIFAALFFLFILWKKLREDYTQNQIFTTGFYILTCIGFGNIISDSFFPAWWFWMSVLGTFLGTLAGILRFHLRVFETLEAVVCGCLTLIGVFFLYDWLNTKDLYSGLGVLGIFVLALVFVLLDSRYKSFTWYKSGKVGFSGLIVAGVFFLVRALIAIFNVDMISFVGRNDIILSGILAFLAFLLVSNLARQT